MSRDGQFGFEHIHNAISVIANLCAYHNRLEPHRVHPPVAVFDRALAAAEGHGDWMDEESMSEDDVTAAASLDHSASQQDDSSLYETADEQSVQLPGEPAAKRQRRQRVASDSPAVDAHAHRRDYGQYEYKWDEDMGTGYEASQFKRGQRVWLWYPTISAWLAAVVTHVRRDGGLNVDLDVSHEKLAVSATYVRPRTGEA